MNENTSNETTWETKEPEIHVGIAEALEEINRLNAPLPNVSHRNGMAASDAVVAELRGEEAGS